MLCPNEIYLSYIISSPPVSVGPILLLPEGEYNGKYYYTWNDTVTGTDFFLMWSIDNNRWEIGTGPIETLTVFAYSTLGDTDCPVGPSKDIWEIVIKDFAEILTVLGLPLPPTLTEEQICYPILVWNKQCEFAQCVLEYLHILQFSGTAPCEKFDKLKNQRRALEILNCYDVRDIPDNTVNYNFLTYNQIKKLLNS